MQEVQHFVIICSVTLSIIGGERNTQSRFISTTVTAGQYEWNCEWP